MSGRGAEKIEAKTVLRVDAPELRVGFNARTPGSWATEQSYVLTEDAAISAYSFRPGGKRLWTIPLSGEVCVASPHVTTDGLTAVVFEESRPKRPGSRIACNQPAVFDIDSGKKLWQVTLPAVTRFDGTPGMAISGGVVAASWSRRNSRWETRTVAYPITGGKALWSEKRNSRKSSQDMDISGGAGLITGVRTYSTRTDHVGREVQKLDPRTGRPEWTYRIPKGYDSFLVASTQPVVLAVSENDYDQESEVTHLLSPAGRSPSAGARCTCPRAGTTRRASGPTRFSSST